MSSQWCYAMPHMRSCVNVCLCCVMWMNIERPSLAHWHVVKHRMRHRIGHVMWMYVWVFIHNKLKRRVYVVLNAWQCTQVNAWRAAHCLANFSQPYIDLVCFWTSSLQIDAKRHFIHNTKSNDNAKPRENNFFFTQNNLNSKYFVFTNSCQH